MACNEAIKHCDRATNQPVDHPDRSLQCQLALGTALQQLVQQAGESGWTVDEIACALLEFGRAPRGSYRAGVI